MPQMSPSDWLMLFYLFNLIMLIFTSINYYSINPPVKFKNYNFKLPNIKFKLKW